MSDCHFLLIEDDSNDAVLVERALRNSRRAATMHHSNSIEDAQRYLLGKPPYDERQKYPIPNAVLCDLRMQFESGMDFLRWVRAHPLYCPTPVIIFSGSHSPRDVVQAYQLGANSLVLKPATMLELTRKLEAVAEYWCDVVETIVCQPSGA